MWPVNLFTKACSYNQHLTFVIVKLLVNEYFTISLNTSKMVLLYLSKYKFKYLGHFHVYDVGYQIIMTSLLLSFVAIIKITSPSGIPLL